MNALELRRRTLGKGVYKKTVEGNPAIAQGSLARRYPGITMQGWTEQAQYEGNQLFNKDSCSAGVLEADGSVNEVSSANYRTTDYIPVNSGMSYTCTKTGSIRGKYFDTEKEPLQTINFQDFNFSAGGEITIPDDVYYIRFSMLEENLETVMLNEGSTALPYEPYTGGQPSPNPDYPQEITSAGKYDEASRKYEYEVKLTGANLFNPDGERVSGLYMGTPLHNKSSVCMKLYEKDPDVDVTGCYIGLSASGISAEGGLGWALSNGNLNNSGLMVTASMDMYVTWFPVGETILQKIINRYDVMVNIGVRPLPYQPYKEQTVTLTADRPLTKWDRLEKRNGQWGWVYKSEEIESYTDESVPGEYFSTTGQLSTGAQVWYETTTETFVPLSESEQEAMNALHTFRPTTVLSNDCDCNMSLTYKTKKSMQSAPGGGIRKLSGITSYFTFGVKWNQVNKIVFKISGVTEKQNMFLCGSGIKTPYIAVSNEYLYPMLNSFSASIPVEEVLDGAYHEIVFTFSTPLLNSSIVNIWDEMWSKTIIYHEIAFYNGDDLLADYVPYYKGAGYMLDKKNNVVIRATNPEDYQFA